MGNSIVGVVTFLFTMTLEDDLIRIRDSMNFEDKINFPRNEEKKIVNNKLLNFHGINEFPDMLIRSDYNGLFNKKIQEELNSNVFQNVMEKDNLENKNSFSSEFISGGKNITLLGAKKWVIVVDRSIDSNIESPRTWLDLLDIKYQNKIGIQGNKDKFCGVLLLHIHKEYGDEGLKLLANNIKNVWHFTDIIKSLGKGKASFAPINVMPLTNAMMITNKESIEIIYPEDGVLTTPIYMMVKREKVEQLNEYIKYIIGEKFEKLLIKNNFYTVHNKFNDEKLKWLGWEYIRSTSNSYDEHKDYLNEVFRSNIKTNLVRGK